MSDPVSHVDLAVTTLMQDYGSNQQFNPSIEFKFLSNIFDVLKFLYGHLNATKDVEKVKIIGTQQLTQNIEACLMRCDVMTRGLFEVSVAYEQNETRLTKDVTQWKRNLKVHPDKVEDMNKQLLEVKKQKETA